MAFGKLWDFVTGRSSRGGESKWEPANGTRNGDPPTGMTGVMGNHGTQPWNTTMNQQTICWFSWFFNVIIVVVGVSIIPKWLTNDS